MNQKDLVLKYIEEYGSIVPARKGGQEYKGGFFGSEISRVCRSLRADGILSSKKWAKDKKFEEFYLTGGQGTLFSLEKPHTPQHELFMSDMKQDTFLK